MLDLAQVVDSISEMCAVTRERQARSADQLQTALAIVRGAESWQALKSRIESHSRVPWLVAGLANDPIDTVVGLPSAPSNYTTIGVDGSQIDLDRHAAAQCFLLNVGIVVIHYGSDDPLTLTSMARLYYKDEDISGDGASEPPDADEDADVPQAPIDRSIQARRTLLESETLSGLVLGNRGRDAVALVDNPLIVWTERGQSDEAVKAFALEFCKMLTAGRDAGVPIAGYISSPGHKDVVGALRTTLCGPACAHRESRRAGSPLPVDSASPLSGRGSTSDPCHGLASLTDAALFRHILASPGERSGLFHSQARAAKHYPDEHKVWFFYLNAGAEMARVEVPAWVKDDPDLLNRVHTVAFDQVVKGQGYPVVLTEAHNQAIVRGPERQAFFLLVERALARAGIPIQITRKALAKRTSVL